MTRRDPLRVRDYLEHIAEAIANIQAYTAGMNAVAYLADRKTQDAVIRNFEVIGEACSKWCGTAEHRCSGIRAVILETCGRCLAARARLVAPPSPRSPSSPERHAGEITYSVRLEQAARVRVCGSRRRHWALS